MRREREGADMRAQLVYLEPERLLCVKVQDRDSSKPILRTWYWPIMECSRYNAELYALGHELQESTSGIYAYAPDPNNTLSYAALRTRFALCDGGRTQAVRVESEPVPPPKVRAGIEVRWRDGCWWKYLKARGWVRA